MDKEREYRLNNTKNKRKQQPKLAQIVKESVKKVLKERVSVNRCAGNPLFNQDEIDYWDNLEFPDDNTYQQEIAMLKQFGKHILYKKIGHDKYNAFSLRLKEDNPEIYSEYIEDKSDALSW